MAFLDEVQFSGSTQPNNVTKPTDGSFLGSVSFSSPATERETAVKNKVQVAKQQADTAKQELKKATSPLGLVWNTVVGVKDKVKSVAENNKQQLISAAKNTWQTYQDTPDKIIDNFTEGSKDINESMSITDPNEASRIVPLYAKGGAKIVGRSIGDFAAAVFAPLSAALGAKLESTGGQKIIDDRGNEIVNQLGITDNKKFQEFVVRHPNFAEDFIRVLDIITLDMSGAKGKPNPKKILGEIDGYAQSIIDQAEKPPRPPEAPTTKTKNPKTSEYEPYTPNDQLPIIDFGNPLERSQFEKSLPTIQTGESVRVTKNSKGDFVYEPIKDSQQNTQTVTTETPATSKFIDSVNTSTESTPVIGETNKVVSKQAQDIARSLDSEFDIQVTDQDLATYKTKEGFMVDQAQKSQALIAENPSNAMDIAMGTKNAPAGLKNESVYGAMKKMAIEAGDTATLLKLAKSKVATRASIKGQDIKALDVLDEGVLDPVRMIQDLQKTTNAAFEKRTGKNYDKTLNENVKQIKDEIKKKAPDKKSWSDFVEQIKCNY